MEISCNSVDVANRELAETILKLQKRAYQVECEITGFKSLPPLEESLEELMGSKEMWIVAEADSLIVGCIAFIYDGESVEICKLFVEPRLFRRGIGSLLLEKLRVQCNGFSKLLVSTAARNLPAIQFYTSHGFSIKKYTLAKEGIELAHLEVILFEN